MTVTSTPNPASSVRWTRANPLLCVTAIAVFLLALATAARAEENVGVRVVRFSSDGRLLAAGCEDGLIVVFGLPGSTTRCVLKPPKGSATLVSLDFRGRTHELLASYNVDSVAQVVAWDADGGRLLRHFEKEDGGALVCSADGRFAANYTFTGTNLWDARTGRHLALLAGETGFSHPLAFSADGHWLAAVEKQDSVCLYDVATRRHVRTLAHAGGGLMAFSRDGRTLATAEPGDGRLKVWNVATGAQVQALRVGSFVLRTAAFSPDGRMVVVGDNNGRGSVWRLRDAKRIAVLEKCGDSLLFNLSGTRVGSHGASGPAILWDGPTWKRVATLVEERVQAGKPAHEPPTACDLAFSADGRWIATADAGTGGRGAVNLWTPALGRFVKKLSLP